MDKLTLIKKEIKDCKLYLNELYDCLKKETSIQEIKNINDEINAVTNVKNKLSDLVSHYVNGIGDIKLQELTIVNDKEYEQYQNWNYNNKLDALTSYNITALKSSLDVINERYLSKQEIYEYLNDYNEFMRFARQNLNIPLINVFTGYMKSTNQNHKNNLEYYIKMIKIHILFVNISILAATKDEDFEYLWATDTEMGEKTKDGELIFLKEKFIVPTDSSRFKKTHIFNFIRNAFCHSDNNELYKITPDCNFVIISLKKTNPISFNVKVSARDINKMTKYIQQYAHQASAFEIENQKDLVVEELVDHYHKCSRQLNKVSLIRKVLPSSIKERKEKIHKELCTKEVAFSKNAFDNVLNKYGSITEIKYRLSEQQKRLLHSKFQHFNNTILEQIGMNFFVASIIFNYMPMGISKMNFLRFDLAVSSAYLFNAENSMYDIIIDIMKDYNELGNGRKISTNKPSVFHFIDKDVDVASRYGWLCLLDEEERENYNDIMLFKYVFGTVNEDEKINIGGVEYDSERIRNALTHNRYRGYRNIRQERCFYLYDDEDTIADPDNAFWSSNFLYDDLRKASEDIVTNYINNKNNSTNKTKVLTK